MLQVHIDRAYNIEAKDLNGKSDPYVKIKIKSQGTQKKVAKTKIIYKTLDPVWDETFDIEVPKGDNDAVISFELVDYDRFNQNDHIDTVEIKLNKLPRNSKCQKVFRVASTSPELVGTLIVGFTTKDCGTELISGEQKLEDLRSRMSFLSAFEMFGVKSTGNLVADYKSLKSALADWRDKELTMERVATLTFHSYDSGAKGYLTSDDLARLADHMFAFMPAQQRANNAKRILQKWQEKHNADQDEFVNPEEFATLVTEILKPNSFKNKEPISAIGQAQDIEQFRQQVRTLLQLVGSPDLYHAVSNPKDNCTKPFSVPNEVPPQDQSKFKSDLAYAFFYYYHSLLIDDIEPADSVNNWRMSVADFYNFIGNTSNKLKNIQIKQGWDSYSLSDFKQEFSKLDEFNLEE